MTRTFFIVCAALILASPARAQAVHEDGNSPISNLRVSDPIVVGTTTLEPGDYKFQCRTIDGEHFLVVTSVEGRKVVARVPCKPEQLNRKVELSEFRTVPGPDGKKKLSAIRIKGETVSHRVVD